MLKQIIIIQNETEYSPVEFANLINQASLEFFIETISECASRRYTNRYFVYDGAKQIMYKDSGLNKLAKEAAKQGKIEFYATKDAAGVCHLTEPHRYYRIEYDMSKELFDEWYMSGTQLEVLSSPIKKFPEIERTAKKYGLKDNKDYFFDEQWRYIVFDAMSVESALYKELTETYPEYK